MTKPRKSRRQTAKKTKTRKSATTSKAIKVAKSAKTPKPTKVVKTPRAPRSGKSRVATSSPKREPRRRSKLPSLRLEAPQGPKPVVKLAGNARVGMPGSFLALCESVIRGLRERQVSEEQLKAFRYGLVRCGSREAALKIAAPYLTVTE